jgi:hypothetical protein
MRKTGLIIFAIFTAVACNNPATDTKGPDSAAARDHTNVYDTGLGSSMTDTSRRLDTSLLPNKMQDTGGKK